jgi:hypothetical protein
MFKPQKYHAQCRHLNRIFGDASLAGANAALISYDRTLYAPTNTTCSGPAGNMMVFDESIDRYNAANVSLNAIDPSKLPRHLG